MRLHLKLMGLLAAFGLLPTLLVGLYGRTALNDLADDLAARGRAMMTERLTHGMDETIRQAASVLDHRRVALEMALRAQAADVARLLDAAPAPSSATRPPDIPFRIAEDAPPGPALAQARRLAALPASFAALKEAVNGGLLRQFVITADGLHVIWPALPSSMPPTPALSEPRLLPWYADALETGDPVWTAPHPDLLSGQLVLTAGMPVLDRTGTVVAVTGIHVSLMAGAKELQNQGNLPAGTTGMLVIPTSRSDGAGDLRLLATSRFPAAPGGAWAPTEATAMSQMSGLPSNEPAFHTLAARLAEGDSGTIRLPYQGQPALWAYGALPGAGVAVIYIIPIQRLNAIAEGAATMVKAAAAGHLAATGGAMLAILGLAVAGAWVSGRQVVEPLRSLGRAMERVARGDMAARAPVTSRDEVGEAARRFNEMVPLLEDRLGLRQALDLAQDVQQALLPATAPKIRGFDLAGVSLYSDETGGDYFDFVPVGPPDRWAVMVGDVSGHGISAALLMTTIRATLRARLPGSDSPSDLLASVNTLLAEDISGGRFMSLFCLFIEAGQAEAVWSSAGHGGCHLFDPASGSLTPLATDDIPLGIDPAWAFAPSHRRALQPGQILLLGTDGLLEARDVLGHEFGTAGLKTALATCLNRPQAPDARTLCDAVLTACAQHRGGQPPRDDTTLVVVRVVDQ